MGLTLTLIPPSSLVRALCSCKVLSVRFSSPLNLSLSGDWYLSEPLLPHFNQSVKCPDLEEIVPPFSFFAGFGPLQARGPWMVAESLFLK